MPTIEDLCKVLPRGSIAWLMARSGPFLKRWANHRAGYSFVGRVTHGGLGRAGIGLARVSGLLRGRNPIELAMFVLRYFFEPFLEEERVCKEEAVFCLNRCPYGWRAPEDASLCEAVMNLERELVKGMGACLIIEETIPSGAARCRFTLRVKGEGLTT